MVVVVDGCCNSKGRNRIRRKVLVNVISNMGVSVNGAVTVVWVVALVVLVVVL